MSADVLEFKGAIDAPAEDLSETLAPIVLVTGQPGAGKTLFALAEFALGKDKVFQRGIPGCALPSWDPTTWQTTADLDHKDQWTVPSPGTTMIVDEAREVYPPRSPNADPPAHYQLHKIRHTGCSLVILAQHPNDIDARVRRLVGRHIHIVEVFGLPEAQVHQWSNKIGDVDARTDSVSQRWKHPKAVYSLYKSSAQHRKTPHVPARLRMVKWLWLGAVLLALAGPLWLWSIYGADAGKPAPGTDPRPTGGVGLRPTQASEAQPVMSAAAYVASFEPRIQGMPHTAPRYDELTAPTVAPRPAACIADAKRCKCFTQQATPFAATEDLCRQIVEAGIFLEYQDATQAAGAPTTAISGTAGTPGTSPPPQTLPEPVRWNVGERRSVLPSSPAL